MFTYVRTVRSTSNDLTAEGVSEQVQTCLCATVQPDHLLRLDVEHDVLPEARLVDL